MINEEEFNFWKTFERNISIEDRREVIFKDITFFRIKNNSYVLDRASNKYIEYSPFNKDYLEKDIFFINCKFHDFTLEEIKFNKKIIFDDCKFFNDINFKNITFKEELGIYDCTFFDVNININSQTSFNEGFRIADNKGKLNLKFNLVYLNRGDFSIFANKNLELFNLEISSCFIYHESYFEIIGNIMNKLKLNDVKNYSHDFLIQHTTIKEEFVLVDCRFNNTRFYNLDLVNCLLNVSGITLDNLSINDIKWVKLGNKFRYKYPNGKTKSNRSLFSEFKNSYEKKGNIIQANEFYALEMKEMEKELKFTKRPFEWLVFKTHSLASNHSQEWLLSLFWIINLTFITTYLSFKS